MPKPVTPIESKVEQNPSLEKRTRRVFTPSINYPSYSKPMPANTVS